MQSNGLQSGLPCVINYRDHKITRSLGKSIRQIERGSRSASEVPRSLSLSPSRSDLQKETEARKAGETAMDEHEFHRLLDLFPVIRSRDYHLESESSKESSLLTTNDELAEWHNAWDDGDNIKRNEVRDIDHKDPFWNKLKLTTESKVGAEEADKFCKAFQRVLQKLVHEELSVEAARRFVNSRGSGQS